MSETGFRRDSGVYLLRILELIQSWSHLPDFLLPAAATSRNKKKSRPDQYRRGWRKDQDPLELSNTKSKTTGIPLSEDVEMEGVETNREGEGNNPVSKTPQI
nr:hypothetical protein Itr_chr03CG14640 [Ipomoea trifida]